MTPYEFERLVWWIGLCWAWWYAWRAYRLAVVAPAWGYRVGPGEEAVAALALKIDEARRFVGEPQRWTVEATIKIRVRGRLYRLSAVELREDV